MVEMLASAAGHDHCRTSTTLLVAPQHLGELDDLQRPIAPAEGAPQFRIAQRPILG
jgi:hypothetical protein